MITTTLTDYQVLKSLADIFIQDPGITVTQISFDDHKDSQMMVRHLKVEENGFTISDDSAIILKNTREYFQNPAMFLQAWADQFFKECRPDMTVLIGSSNKTLQVAVTASLNEIPITHIHGGETGYGLWDESYGFGITKLSNLHFAATENFRQQIIAFGENEGSVFNVGSLLVEKAETIYRQDRHSFNRCLGLETEDKFILVDLHPDSQLGSKNEKMVLDVIKALEDETLKSFKIVVNQPKETGFGQIIARTIQSFKQQYPDRVVACPLMALADLCSALDHCDMLVGNHPDSLILASVKRKPAVQITQKNKNRICPANQIDVPSGNSRDLVQAIDIARSKDFRRGLSTAVSPFEQKGVAQKIKEKIDEFAPGRIAVKAHYTADRSAVALPNYSGGNIIH